MVDGPLSRALSASSRSCAPPSWRPSSCGPSSRPSRSTLGRRGGRACRSGCPSIVRSRHGRQRVSCLCQSDAWCAGPSPWSLQNGQVVRPGPRDGGARMMRDPIFGGASRQHRRRPHWPDDVMAIVARQVMRYELFVTYGRIYPSRGASSRQAKKSATEARLSNRGVASDHLHLQPHVSRVHVHHRRVRTERGLLCGAPTETLDGRRG